MNVKIRRMASDTAPFFSGAIAILLAMAIVSNPETSFQASLQGLKLWWNLVFPALLPFLILSEMLAASGFVHGLGVLLEPLMRRVFRLPGESGWTLWLGLTTGFPGGAHGVLQLHKQGSLSDKEAGRLAALVHFGSPVTLLIVVGVAFLHSPTAGYGLLAVHWLSGLLAGFTAVVLGQSTEAPAGHQRSVKIPAKKSTLYKRIISAAVKARSEDRRSFGKLLGDSVGSSVQSLMIVGGYMIMFAVVINIVLGLFPQLPASIPAGLLEIHLGAKTLSELSISAPNALTGWVEPALLSAALGWSGLCAQLQVLAVLKPAHVRFLPFAAVRLLHGLYAFLLTPLLWKPLMNIRETALPAIVSSEAFSTGSLSLTTVWSAIPHVMGLQSLLLLLLLLFSGISALISAFQRRFD
ncbi:nucleoside recognition protein [Paenibacillus sp. BR2-3]|uniref:nucleoside recognition domain-containing protein n=1 Tax=Paenibacillus sp. BR2-3 TaxID=3048494 RepID=UPI003977D2C1